MDFFPHVVMDFFHFLYLFLFTSSYSLFSPSFSVLSPFLLSEYFSLFFRGAHFCPFTRFCELGIIYAPAPLFSINHRDNNKPIPLVYLAAWPVHSPHPSTACWTTGSQTTLSLYSTHKEYTLQIER